MLGFFASADAIADAKAEILEQARPDDLLVANADDRADSRARRRFAGTVRDFRYIGPVRTYRASDVRHRGLDGMTATLATPHGRACASRRRCSGRAIS